MSTMPLPPRCGIEVEFDPSQGFAANGHGDPRKPRDRRLARARPFGPIEDRALSPDPIPAVGVAGNALIRHERAAPHANVSDLTPGFVRCAAPAPGAARATVSTACDRLNA